METFKFIKIFFIKTWLKTDKGFKLNEEVNPNWFANITKNDNFWYYDIGKRNQNNLTFYACIIKWKKLKDAKQAALNAIEYHKSKKYN